MITKTTALHNYNIISYGILSATVEKVNGPVVSQIIYLFFT